MEVADLFLPLTVSGNGLVNGPGATLTCQPQLQIPFLFASCPAQDSLLLFDSLAEAAQELVEPLCLYRTKPALPERP